MGEAACVSVHGANRLGSNSLLDLVVFGRSVARHISKTLSPNTTLRPIERGIADKALDRFDKMRYSKGDQLPSEIRLNMQKTMQNYSVFCFQIRLTVFDKMKITQLLVFVGFWIKNYDN